MVYNNIMKIIKLDIEEFDMESGVDKISLVMSPAIEENFMYFNSQEFESYTDYPKQATENARIALRWADENGWGSCGTPVGKARANQLAKGEPITEETIARMAAFERHRQNSDKELGDGCGRLMWLAWGGDAGVEWAQRKLQSIRKEKLNGTELNVLGYETEYFYICPGAIKTFTHLMEMEPDEETAGMIRSAAQIADNIFKIEADVLEDKEADLDDLGQAQTLLDDFYDLMKEIDELLGMEHDVSYMDGHIEVIRKYIDEVIFEELLKEVLQEQKYIDDLPQDRQDAILEQLELVGESREALEKDGWVIEEMKDDFAITSKPNISSLEDYGKFQIRYQYTGPKDSKNRNFCARMLSKDLIFRKEDINKLTIQGENSEFGIYDIFTYKGSYGCRHHWTRLRMFKGDEGKEITQYEESEDTATSVNPKPTLNRNPDSPTLTESSFSEHNKEKQMVVGPIMVPEKLIYRYDDYNGEFWVYFSKDTIERIAHKYLINNYQSSVNIEHSEDNDVEDVTLVESWLVEDPEKDKSYAMMGKKYPKGTWFGSMKINNKKVWDEYIKEGKVLGWSVEGFFADKMINSSKQTFFYRTTDGGTEIVIDENSSVVFILKDGERTAVMPDGEYELTNGKTLVVVDSKAEEGSF